MRQNNKTRCHIEDRNSCLLFWGEKILSLLLLLSIEGESLLLPYKEYPTKEQLKAFVTLPRKYHLIAHVGVAFRQCLVLKQYRDFFFNFVCNQM